MSEDQVEAVTRAIRSALIEDWKNVVTGDDWREDILLTGCKKAGGMGYHKPEEAAQNLAKDAARAAIAAMGSAAKSIPDEESAGKTATRLLAQWVEIECADDQQPYQETMAFLGKPNSSGWIWAHEVRFERNFEAEQERTRNLALECINQKDAEIAAMGEQSHSQISALDDASNACLELAAKHGFATGHGDTVADMIREFSAQIPMGEQWRDISIVARNITVEIMKERARAGSQKAMTLEEWQTYIITALKQGPKT